MVILYHIVGLISFLAACKYVPGLKCITYCRYKTIRKNRAIAVLKDICDIDHSKVVSKVKAINVENISPKKLHKTYKDIQYFGCSSFTEPNWLPSARDILKETIAEFQLLEII